MIRGVLLALALACALFLTPVLDAAPDPDRGTLIVFTQPASPVGTAFAADTLPAIRALADSLGVEVQILDIAHSGAPQEVGFTPLLVYQNYRGRSVYQGRFTNLGRLHTFLRTARYVPQEPGTQTRHHLPVLEGARSRIACPLKISPLTGTLPADFDSAAFASEFTEGLAPGFQRLHFTESVSLTRSDRLFYMDFHPWRSEAGELFVSAQLFSPFDCETPVFTTATQPLTGPWEARPQVFAAAARTLESALLNTLQDPTQGDGLDFVPPRIRVVSWSDLALDLPRAPATVTPQATLPSTLHWHVLPAHPDQEPSIQFRFPAPLDHYRGTVGEVAGELTLETPRSLTGASGWVTAGIASVTLGQGDLDSVIHDAPFLGAAQHPQARFELTALHAPDDTLSFGIVTLTDAEGTFSMRGRTIPLRLRVQVEPILDAAQHVMLSVRGGFTLRLKESFGSLGADGPSPQNDTVQVSLALRLAPDPR